MHQALETQKDIQKNNTRVNRMWCVFNKYEK